MPPRDNNRTGTKLIIYVVVSIVIFSIYLFYALKNWSFEGNLSQLLFKTPLATIITLNTLLAIVSALMCGSQNNERKLQTSKTSGNNVTIIDNKGISSPLSNKSATPWITDPSDRHNSLEERKRLMVEQARRKYLEKHPDTSVNTPSKSKVD